MNIPPLCPLLRRFPLRAGWVSSFFLAVLILTVPPPARGQSLRQRLEASEAQDRANEIVRQMRALKNMQQRPSDPGYQRSSPPEYHGPSESKLKADQVNGIMDVARAAAARGDLREALRLAREAQPIAQTRKFKAELENWIRALETDIIRNETWNAAVALKKEADAAFNRQDSAGALTLYKRALATDPNCLTEDGKKWVQDLESRLNAANASQQTLDAFVQNLRSAPSPGELDFVSGATSVVDARNVPSGLPKSVEEMIPATPAGDRVRKGFQAIADRDWTVAKAWFEDALNREPGDAGLQRLVDLAQFTLEKNREKAPPARMSQAEINAVTAMMDDAFDQWGRDELDKALNDYVEKHPELKADPAPSAPPPTASELRAERAQALLPPPSAPPKLTWKAFSDALFKPLPKSKHPSVSAVRG